MSALEVRKRPAGKGICEFCLVEKGPSRSALYAIFICGHPAGGACAVHKQLYEREFAAVREEAA